ncbi:PTPA-CTERM sorting domain-containing protein [Phormidium tenue]|uniref:Uncharacterized protein n=1 Tax=Phormidium tenue NIES-30 TaxID=549789 RepID=A0A1U7J8Y8_9CYAN|nr:PTPA-CTERM sorting domain-containing protein [Phormidium tenue]MBD2231067.1 PTPA-CTERM sorting domain-containing protein [Phormidium tenue FACHB-1052]OKH49901.1 hypothetical protein NIES30_04095 [Phormidium tenue NIES-30]
MKERLTGIGLIVGTALMLCIVWADSAQAFSLGKTVTVTNLLDKDDLDPEIFQGPTDVAVVGSEVELEQFGGIWDIDLGDNSILFVLNSRFSNVASGQDIYRFKAPDFGLPGQKSVTGFTVTPLLGSLVFGKAPMITQVANNWIDVVFPLGFAPDNVTDLTQIPGKLGFKIDLTVEPTPEPTPVPTPALLPGLVGMGLAILRQRREDDQSD